MIIAWMLAAVLAEAAGGHEDRIVVPVPGATMTCTKEGNQLVCVLPLDQATADASPRPADPAPKAQPYKPTAPTPALPNPEAKSQLKVAKANIELAKSLVPKATTPEESVLAQQMLYWANEQYRTAEALLHTVQGNLQRAPDPFEAPSRDGNADSMTLCAADVTDACDSRIP